MSRSTAELDRLAAVDNTLSARWTEATGRLREILDTADSGLIGTDLTDAVHAEAAVREVLGDIRAVPGFEAFLRPLTCAEIVTAGDGLPVVYIVNAPAGTVVLGVGPNGDRPIVHAIEVPKITSVDVMRVVVLDDENRPTLLLAQSGNAAHLRRELPRALERLTELRPIAAGVETVLARFGADGAPTDTAVVVPTGLLGLVPLHALPASNEPFLDDVLEIRLAPSAAIYAASARRARERRAIALVAVADTVGSAPLPAARCEANHIRSVFGDRSAIFVGSDATRQRVISSARHCSHLHLACHGKSRLDDPLGGSLDLADARLTVNDLLDGRLNQCRLVVASACQSGHYALADISDDFTGLAAGFLQAGAAAAVVSLWQVGDVSTALLISYFYEQLCHVDAADVQDPPTALRAARQWLRHLTYREARDFLRDRNELAPLLARLPHNPDDHRLFATLPIWAPFYCYGS